jgi:membrane protein DedA with SNARE-associated domain
VNLTAILPYLALILGTAAEGEVVFVGASVAVGAGKLHALPVFLVGALGSALGDQFYFYVLRGRVSRWVDRWPAIVSRRATVERILGRYSGHVAFGMRFTPGLRIALAATCAYARVPAVRFSVFNLLGAIAWAAAMLSLVAFGGPLLARRLRVNNVALMIGLALAFVSVTLVAGRVLRRRLQHLRDAA